MFDKIIDKVVEWFIAIGALAIVFLGVLAGWWIFHVLWAALP